MAVSRSSQVSQQNDVLGPASATDNAVTRFDGTTGKLVQNSAVLIDDTNNVTGMTTLTLPNDGLHILDSNATHDLIITPGSNLTADRVLTITTGDAARTISLSGNLTLAGSLTTVGGFTTTLTATNTTSLTLPTSGTLATRAQSTYTPIVTLVGGAGNTVPVYSTNSGYNEQIGGRQFVTIQLDGDGGAEGAGTGQINISLPAAAAAGMPVLICQAGQIDNGATSNIVTITIQPGASVCTLSYQSALGTSTSLTGNSQNNASRGIYLNFNYPI